MGRNETIITIGNERIKIPMGTNLLLLLAGAALLLLVGAKQTMFTIRPEEQGILLRFGKYVRTVDPGLHFKLPLGVEDVFKVPVQRQLKQEFGFRTAKSGSETPYVKRGYEGESLMLTGDLNSADVEWVVQYRITDPVLFLFNVRSVESTFRDISEATMREIVGDHSVDEVITWGKEQINQEVNEKLQERCEQYETGITIQVVLLQDVNAPPPVQPSWNEVNAAEQEKDQLVNQAKTKYNAEVPQAQGEASQVIKEAEGYALERVNWALGDREKFIQVYKEYRKAPDVTRRRIYLETMTEIMPKAGRKIVVDEDEKGVIRFLNLSEEGVVK